jgi:hypothetical protein
MVLAATTSAWAQDPFEIQVYDAETAPKLQPGIEIHMNYVIRGVETAVGPVLPTNGVFHLTFEPHLGVARFAEVGAYLQTALRPDGSYDYAGVKLRFKARVPRRLVRGLIGLALNTEVDFLPRAYSDARFGGELRPIIDLRSRWVYASVNPILAFDFEGPVAGHPLLEPAAKLDLIVWESAIGLGVEYYGAFGPIDSPVAASQQVHNLFGVVDVDLSLPWVHLALNLGTGYGLGAGDRWIFKSIVGIDLERPAVRRAATGG